MKQVLTKIWGWYWSRKTPLRLAIGAGVVMAAIWALSVFGAPP